MINWRDWLPVRQARVRPLATTALSTLAGMLLAFWLRLDTRTTIAALCVAGLMALPCAWKRRYVMPAVLLVAVCLGAVRMSAEMARFPAVRTQYNVQMVGRVDSEPWIKPESGRLIFKYRLKSVNDAPVDRVVRLYVRGERELMDAIEYGQTLAVKGHIWATDPVTNPYEFDFAQWLHTSGMACIATAKVGDVEVVSGGREIGSVVIEARQAIGTRIDALFPRSAPLVRALVLGDRSMLSDEVRESLNATGTAHLISISGLHVTVLAVAFSMLLGCFMPRRWANLATLLPLLAYGALIGYTAPFVRAMVMFAIYSFAVPLGLPSDAVTRLAIAMMIWLFIRPMSLFEAGFELSFSASAGIILLTNPLLRLFHLDAILEKKVGWRLRKRIPHQLVVYFATLLCASLAAQLATLPLTTAMFGAQSVVSLAFNMVCVPMCVVGYILAMIALALSAVFMPLGSALAVLPDRILALLMTVTAAGRALPIHSVRIGRYTPALAVLHVALVLATSDMCAISEEARRYFPLGIAALAAVAALTTWLAAWPLSLTVLDAEEAACAVLTTQGHTYVFDTGDTYSPVADYLGATCLRLDGVFLSHPHQDHAGGLFDLLSAIRPEVIYVPAGWYDYEDTAEAVDRGLERAREMGVPIVELSAGDGLSLSDDTALTVYNPTPESALTGDVNDISLLLHVVRGGRSVLFTGDLTMDGEPERMPDCDVLMAPHHGSDNATSVHMLAETTPEYVVIPVGENSNGHPGEWALERMMSSGATILRTDRDGAIRLTLRGDEWRVWTFLEASDELE